MAHRVIEVFEAVALFGPITLDDLTKKLPRSRSSVYRALVALYKDGWIRRSINGRSYYISPRLENLCDRQYLFDGDFCDLLDVLDIYLASNKLSVTVAVLLKGAEFIVLDANSFPIPNSLDCLIMKELISEVARIVNEVGKKVTDTLDGHNYMPISENTVLAELHNNGFMYYYEADFAVIPVKTRSGEVAYVIIEDLNLDVTSFCRAKRAFQEIIDRVGSKGLMTFKMKQA